MDKIPAPLQTMSGPLRSELQAYEATEEDIFLDVKGSLCTSMFVLQEPLGRAGFS